MTSKTKDYICLITGRIPSHYLNLSYYCSIVIVSQEIHEPISIVMTKNYPEHLNTLQRLMGELSQEIPATMKGFSELHTSSIGAGALSAKIKELIALGIAITVRCDGCISFHVHDALKAGAARSEILETISVAILMGGGPSVMYGCEALEALNQFEANSLLISKSDRPKYLNS